MSASTPQLTSSLSGVLIDGRLQDFFVMWASGSFKENEHASMSLYVDTSTRATDYGIMPGQRIEFTFGSRGNSQKFQGYVTAITPHQRLNGDKVIDEQEIQCMGPSMVLKGNKPRFFTEVTCTQAIARIVAESSLGFSDEFRRDETTWRTLAQTSETDWEMIVNLAERIGAHVVVTSGVVRLVDYNEIMARVLPTRVYTKQQQIPASIVEMVPPAGMLLDFTPTNQSTMDPFYDSSSLAYMVGGQAVEVPKLNQSGRFSLSNFSTKMPARTVQEAQTLQDGFYIPPWVQEAEIRVMGDATVAPATTVDIVSRGDNPDFDGIWYVKEVSHRIATMVFVTTMQIGRVAQRAPNWKADYPFWMGDQRGVPSLFPSGTGQWLSTWRQTL